jgi:hypothetical protein
VVFVESKVSLPQVNKQKPNQAPKSREYQDDFLAANLRKLSDNTTFNRSVDWTSNILLASLFSASLFESRFIKLPEQFIKRFSRFADLANRVFQALNSSKNISKLYPRKDYLGAFGHAGDWIALAVSKSKDHYNDRGLFSLCWYFAAHAFNIINERDEFNNWQDYINHIQEALRKTKKNFFTEPNKFLEKLLDHRHAMMAIIASALSFSGGFLWRPLEYLFGGPGRAVATTLRSLGGIFFAAEAMKPGHIASGRLYYGLSGYAQGLGAVMNIISDTVGKKFKEAIDPLSFAFSSLGRIFLRMSYNRAEAAFASKPFSLENFKNNLRRA